jgi:hypothetical protein
MLKKSYETKNYIIKVGNLFLSSSSTHNGVQLVKSEYGAYVFEESNYKLDDLQECLRYKLKDLEELSFNDVKIIERITKVEVHEQEVKVDEIK